MAITSNPVFLTQQLRDDLVRLGNYTHPLFHDVEKARATGMKDIPFPGQAILLIAGGAVEASGAVENAIALLSLTETNFLSAAFPGDEIRVEIIPGESKATKDPSKVKTQFNWRIINQNDQLVATTSATMLLSR
jgi:acyl dehydratase